MRLFSSLMTGLILFFASKALPAQMEATDAKLSLHKRVWIASQIYSMINTYFGHWLGVPELDLDTEFQCYLDQIIATDDRRSFDLASMEFLGKLRNGHSGFRDKWLQHAYGQAFGFYAYPIDDRWVVTRSKSSVLKPGDVIASIDGQDFELFFRGLRKYISASDERWARRAFFEYPYLFPKTFSLELADGRRVSITRQGEVRWPGEEEHDTTVRANDGVAYIVIPSFTDPKLEQEAVQAVQQYENLNAIIIDVRGNHGGSTPLDLTARLMDRPYRWYVESTPISIGLFKYLGSLGEHSDIRWYGSAEKPGDHAYHGSVYILVDGGCFSACEDFVVPFKDNHRATIVGERTAGSSGQPFDKDLDDGMVVGLGTKREFLPDGSAFEGIGVVPDVEVHTSLEDLRVAKDPVLAKANGLIQELKNQK